MHFTLLIASDFSGLLPILLGAPAGAALLSLLSLWPAAKGHWLAVVLAVPPLLVGLFFIFLFAITSGGALPVFWITAALPVGIGAGSLSLFTSKRKEPGPPAKPDPS